VKPIDPATAATVKGRVLLKLAVPGKLPVRRRVRMDSDPKCAALHTETPLSDEVVVNATEKPEFGAVQWAFVHVRKGLEGRTFEVPKVKPVLNQLGCRYEPHVLGVMAGQEFDIMNSDDLLHNIHALPMNNKEFNEGQPSKGMVSTRKFSTAEVPVKIKCDIHPWMGAWVCVVGHPYYQATGEKGAYELGMLPPGHYAFEVWHERYANGDTTKRLVKEVHLAEKQVLELDLIIDEQ
jgi:plastocyanin